MNSCLRFSVRSRCALAEHHVVAFHGLEPPVQYLQNSLRVFFVLRRVADQFAANSQRFGEAAAVEINRELRTFGVGVRWIERRRATERLGSFVKPREPVQ